MLIGYARVSTQDQDLTLQLEALNEAGCEKIFEDRVSGAKADRDGLRQAMTVLQEGDTVVVWKLDRLGRSLKDLISIINALANRDVHFRSLTDSIDTSTPSGRFFFHVMVSLAQMERELIAERTRAGRDAARKQGRVGGRPREITDAKIAAATRLLQDGTSYREVSKTLGVAVPTLYRWVPATELPEQAVE